MLEFDIPGQPPLTIEHVVLDLNGTIARDGEILPGVGAALASLAGRVTVTVLTADTHGKAAGLRSALGVDVRVISGTDEAAEKQTVVEELGRERVFAVGNGANDALMLKTAAIGVCVIGPEGASPLTLANADAVVTSIADALGLLLHPARLVATLRT